MTGPLGYTPIPSEWKPEYVRRILETMYRVEPLESLPPATRKIEAQRRRAGAAAAKTAAMRIR